MLALALLSPLWWNIGHGLTGIQIVFTDTIVHTAKKSYVLFAYWWTIAFSVMEILFALQSCVHSINRKIPKAFFLPDIIWMFIFIPIQGIPGKVLDFGYLLCKSLLWVAFLQWLPCNVIRVKYLRLGMICGCAHLLPSSEVKETNDKSLLGKIYLLLRVNWIRDNISTAKGRVHIHPPFRNQLIFRMIVFFWKPNFWTKICEITISLQVHSVENKKGFRTIPTQLRLDH